MEAERERARRLLAKLPSGMLLAAALLAGLPTLTPLALLNLGALPSSSLMHIFLAIYAVQLPLSLYTGHRIAVVLDELYDICRRGREVPRPVLLAASAAPLGFIVPLSSLGTRLAACKLVQAQKLGNNGLDLALNVMTLGLHAIIYASILERILSSITEEADEMPA